MQKFIKSTANERKNIIQKSANDLGLRFDIIEKDIWVCYVLQKLFSNQKLKDNLIFKGGTCLSKAYNAIGRFSEDVDITINSQVLDISGESQKIDKIKSRNRKATRIFVENEILPILSESFDDELGSKNYELIFDETDKNNVTLFFQFPFPSKEYKTSEITTSLIELMSRNITSLARVPGEIINQGNYIYIKPKIKLEFGALGGIWPVTKKTIKPYAKEILPNYFDEFEVSTLDIKRNFIEKLLILHSIVLRPSDKSVNPNYSRHYYDVYSIIKNDLNIDPTKDLEILESVVKNKHDFWNESWIKYKNIKKFSDIKLIPNEARIVEIKKDYKNMEEMFFDYFPKFEEMMSDLQDFEDFLIKEK
jgi:predicted nucleotidyltransferase component of viral defense system